MKTAISLATQNPDNTYQATNCSVCLGKKIYFSCIKLSLSVKCTLSTLLICPKSTFIFEELSYPCNVYNSMQMSLIVLRYSVSSYSHSQLFILDLWVLALGSISIQYMPFLLHILLLDGEDIPYIHTGHIQQIDRSSYNYIVWWLSLVTIDLVKHSSCCNLLTNLQIYMHIS